MRQHDTALIIWLRDFEFRDGILRNTSDCGCSQGDEEAHRGLG